MLRTNVAIVLSLTVAACTSDGEGQTSAELTGSAVYRDARTSHDGAPAEPAAPPPQSAHVSLVIKGSGQIPNVDPKCTLDPAGAFEAHYLSTLDMSDGNVYVAAIASGSGTLQTPSGCTVPDLEVGLITDIVVRGELTINTTNCQTFCAARARSEAEAQCGATASSATCRAASCTTTCTTKASKIVAEVSLAASLLGQLDADALRAAALGELHADLTFDQMVDATGKSL
jgi:hypothetical protein